MDLKQQTLLLMGFWKEESKLFNAFLYYLTSSKATTERGCTAYALQLFCVINETKERVFKLVYYCSNTHSILKEIGSETV